MTLELVLPLTGALLCGGLAAVALLRDRRSFVQRVFALGMLALAAEAALTALGARAATEADVLRWQRLRLAVTALVPGIWLIFSLSYARSERRAFLTRWRRVVWMTFAVPLGLALLFGGAIFLRAAPIASFRWLLPLGWAGYAFQVVLLVSSVFILMNLEKTLRASTGSIRWFIKFMILGVGGLFAIRIYTSSQTLLFLTFDTGLEVVNGGALVIAVVLMVVSLSRTRLREVDVYLSPSVLYHSLVLLLVGLYLIAVGLLAKAVTYLGGVQALPVATFMVFVALLGLTVMLMSEELRQRARSFVNRNFGRPHYDYRKEWMAFTRRTSSLLEMKPLCAAVARMVSETLHVPSVTLWLRDEAGEGIIFGGSTVYSEAEGTEVAAREGIALVEIMGERSAPVDFHQPGERSPDTGRLRPNRYGVALTTGRECLGFMVLGERAQGEPLSLEDFDLLKTVADQAAANLLNLRLSDRLLRAKEMEAFQSLSAFFVHDLKNLASKLSLSMQNLPAHYDDPEFRSDLLAVISRSVSKINEMCSRLSPLSRRLELERTESDLNEVVRGTLEGLNSSLKARLVQELQPTSRLLMDAEQMQKVLLNLVLNANEAVADGGEIRVSTGSLDGGVYFAVEDNGCGMSREFMDRFLFQPFQTTKRQGLGIGLFHSRKIVEAHCGRIEVQSEEGKGSTFRVTLPAEEG